MGGNIGFFFGGGFYSLPKEVKIPSVIVPRVVELAIAIHVAHMTLHGGIYSPCGLKNLHLATQCRGKAPTWAI